MMSFDATVLQVEPRTEGERVAALVAAARDVLPEPERNQGVDVALSVIDSLGLGLDALVPQLRLNVANDFYRDAQHHRIRYGERTQAYENDGERLREATAGVPREELPRLIEEHNLGLSLVRITQERRRALFACLSCLYACQEAVLYHIALEMTGFNRQEASAIAHLAGLDGWKKLFDKAEVASGRHGFGTQDERLARLALDLRGDLTHSEDHYTSIPLAGAEPPEPSFKPPSYSDLTVWGSAVRDTLRLYAAKLGHPECAELQLQELDIPSPF
jgi:hypothetical protein